MVFTSKGYRRVVPEPGAVFYEFESRRWNYIGHK
jgi:hypothetical protein